MKLTCPAIIVARSKKEKDGKTRCRVLVETPYGKEWCSVAPENYDLLPHDRVEVTCDFEVWYMGANRFLTLKGVR